MTTLLRLCSAFLLLIWMACGAQAEEVIRDYHADITVFPDATIEVTETITVYAEGDKIQRGIFRDFPLYAQDARGFRQKVDFELISVERDGRPRNHTEIDHRRHPHLCRLGRRLPAPGEYTYTITYRTGRQIRYFDDHDELYWNVTGNGWLFPIDRGGATVFAARQRTTDKGHLLHGPVRFAGAMPGKSRGRTASSLRPRGRSARTKA